jgi:hypothetical protein
VDGLVESGVDIVADSVDGCAWIALLAPAARGAEDLVALVDAARAQLARNDAAEPRLLNVGLMPANALPDDQQVAEPRGAITLLWELRRAPTVLPALPRCRSRATRRQHKVGVVRLVPPGESLIGVGLTRGRRTNAAASARTPRLDDPQQARLIAWLRSARSAAGRVGSLKSPGWRARSIVEQMSTLENAIVGDADGSADARIQLPAGNVDGASLQIDLAEDGSTWERWERVDDLATLPPRSGRRARARARRAGGHTAGRWRARPCARDRRAGARDATPLGWRQRGQPPGGNAEGDQRAGHPAGPQRSETQGRAAGRAARRR